MVRIETRRVYGRLFERDPHRKLVEQELEGRTRSFFRGLEVEV